VCCSVLQRVAVCCGVLLCVIWCWRIFFLQNWPASVTKFCSCVKQFTPENAPNSDFDLFSTKIWKFRANSGVEMEALNTKIAQQKDGLMWQTNSRTVEWCQLVWCDKEMAELWNVPLQLKWSEIVTFTPWLYFNECNECNRRNQKAKLRCLHCHRQHGWPRLSILLLFMSNVFNFSKLLPPSVFCR